MTYARVGQVEGHKPQRDLGHHKGKELQEPVRPKIGIVPPERCGNAPSGKERQAYALGLELELVEVT